MVYLGRTIERNMHFGASPDIFLKAKQLRKKMTGAEKVLWKRLRNRKIEGAYFRRQHPIDIFIVDFYCHNHKLVIEVDGDIHKKKEISERDYNRTAELEKYGLKVIRFSNHEVMNQPEKVIDTIRKEIRK